MRRTEVLQEIRQMRFEESYGGWTEGRLSQEEAAQLLGVCERTFRRYINRYEEEGLDGLIDKRLSQVSHRRAPVDEVMRLVDRYRSRHEGWSVKHYYAWYLPAFDEEFEQPPREAGSAFVPVPEGTQLDNIFCERYECQVRKDNCIEFGGLTLQIPVDRHRYHYIKAKVKVLRHTDGALSLWHGPRKLAGYDAAGQLIQTDLPVAA